jgi:hypothetical protein
MNTSHKMNESRITNKPRAMNPLHNFRFYTRLGFALALAGTLSAQSAPNKTLVVNGKTVEAVVRQIDGHSYIDVETLAQITNGSVFIEPTRVVLKIPGAEAGAATAATPAATVAAVPVQPPPGLSRAFAGAAIAAVADLREWRGAISAMITHGLAVSDSWAQGYRDQAHADLSKAEVAARTDADRNALGLLRNEAGNLTSWSDGVLAARQNLNGAATVDPNALLNDTALAKIRSCSQFLNVMLVSGDFADDASCH